MAISFRPRKQRKLSRTSIAGLLVLVALIAWSLGFLAFVSAIPETVDDPTAETDAIVVLTGGSGRLEEGIALLSDKRAKKLFVSGVYQGVDVQQLLDVSRKAPEELSCCIALGYAANSTLGNAVETAEWVADERYRSIRLVTANYHMPRSLIEFHHAMPNIRIVPHAVFPSQFKREEWWQYPGTTQLILIEYLKYLAASVRHGAEFMLAS
jgi:uncharacterized SAM-binding protein YcdF (DUF218 family)